MFKKSTLALPLAVGLLASLAACSASPEAPASPDGGSSAATDACIAAVTEAVDAKRAPLELVLPTEPLDLAAVAGKKVWVINVLTNQFISDSNSGYEAAAKAAGVDLTIFDGEGSANKWNEGVQQAIAQGADAIALFGIDSKIVSEAVKEADAAGIPIVEGLATNYDSDQPAELFSNISADYYSDGAALADWTLMDSKCTANTYLLYSTGLPIWVDTRDGVMDTYAERCPECVITEENLDLANVATDIPRVVQTKMTQAPDTKYLLATWDSAVPFIESAAAQINPDAVILGRDGIDAALESIRGDGMQKVTVASPQPQWIAWTVMDDMLRAIAGQEPNGIVVPTLLVDKTNVGATNADVLPNYVDFEDQFVKAWGK